MSKETRPFETRPSKNRPPENRPPEERTGEQAPRENRATNNPPGDNREPLTEEEIRAHTIVDLKAESGGIVIEEYDARWAEVFAREAERIRSVLESSALRIEHVGSTSVAGLSAKPIIDMVLEVSDSAKEDEYVPALEAAGYLLRMRESEWNEHRMFKGPEAEINLHVFSSAARRLSAW
jgi:GrpB-like predicted nucleotidyltransferase (UPF0157 family)